MASTRRKSRTQPSRRSSRHLEEEDDYLEMDDDDLDLEMDTDLRIPKKARKVHIFDATLAKAMALREEERNKDDEDRRVEWERRDKLRKEEEARERFEWELEEDHMIMEEERTERLEHVLEMLGPVEGEKALKRLYEAGLLHGVPNGDAVPVMEQDPTNNTPAIVRTHSPVISVSEQTPTKTEQSPTKRKLSIIYRANSNAARCKRVIEVPQPEWQLNFPKDHSHHQTGVKVESGDLSALEEPPNFSDSDEDGHERLWSYSEGETHKKWSELSDGIKFTIYEELRKTRRDDAALLDLELTKQEKKEYKKLWLEEVKRSASEVMCDTNLQNRMNELFRTKEGVTKGQITNEQIMAIIEEESYADSPPINNILTRQEIDDGMSFLRGINLPSNWLYNYMGQLTYCKPEGIPAKPAFQDHFAPVHERDVMYGNRPQEDLMDALDPEEMTIEQLKARIARGEVLYPEIDLGPPPYVSPEPEEHPPLKQPKKEQRPFKGKGKGWRKGLKNAKRPRSESPQGESLQNLPKLPRTGNSGSREHREASGARFNFVASGSSTAQHGARRPSGLRHELDPNRAYYGEPGRDSSDSEPEIPINSTPKIQNPFGDRNRQESNSSQGFREQTNSFSERIPSSPLVGPRQQGSSRPRLVLNLKLKDGVASIPNEQRFLGGRFETPTRTQSNPQVLGGGRHETPTRTQSNQQALPVFQNVISAQLGRVDLRPSLAQGGDPHGSSPGDKMIYRGPDGRVVTEPLGNGMNNRPIDSSSPYATSVVADRVEYFTSLDRSSGSSPGPMNPGPSSPYPRPSLGLGQNPLSPSLGPVRSPSGQVPPGLSSPYPTPSLGLGQNPISVPNGPVRGSPQAFPVQQVPFGPRQAPDTRSAALNQALNGLANRHFRTQNNINALQQSSDLGIHRLRENILAAADQFVAHFVQRLKYDKTFAHLFRPAYRVLGISSSSDSHINIALRRAKELIRHSGLSKSLEAWFHTTHGDRISWRSYANFQRFFTLSFYPKDCVNFLTKWEAVKKFIRWYYGKLQTSKKFRDRYPGAAKFMVFELVTQLPVSDREADMDRAAQKFVACCYPGAFIPLVINAMEDLDRPETKAKGLAALENILDEATSLEAPRWAMKRVLSHIMELVRKHPCVDQDCDGQEYQLIDEAIKAVKWAQALELSQYRGDNPNDYSYLAQSLLNRRYQLCLNISHIYWLPDAERPAGAPENWQWNQITKLLDAEFLRLQPRFVAKHRQKELEKSLGKFLEQFATTFVNGDEIFQHKWKPIVEICDLARKDGRSYPDYAKWLLKSKPVVAGALVELSEDFLAAIGTEKEVEMYARLEAIMQNQVNRLTDCMEKYLHGFTQRYVAMDEADANKWEVELGRHGVLYQGIVDQLGLRALAEHLVNMEYKFGEIVACAQELRQEEQEVDSLLWDTLTYGANFEEAGSPVFSDEEVEESSDGDADMEVKYEGQNLSGEEALTEVALGLDKDVERRS